MLLELLKDHFSMFSMEFRAGDASNRLLAFGHPMGLFFSCTDDVQFCKRFVTCICFNFKFCAIQMNLLSSEVVSLHI